MLFFFLIIMFFFQKSLYLQSFGKKASLNETLHGK